MIMFRV
jgi:hypothetical protein